MTTSTPPLVLAVAIIFPPGRHANLKRPAPRVAGPTLNRHRCLCFGAPRTLIAASSTARGVVIVCVSPNPVPSLCSPSLTGGASGGNPFGIPERSRLKPEPPVLDMVLDADGAARGAEAQAAEIRPLIAGVMSGGVGSLPDFARVIRFAYASGTAARASEAVGAVGEQCMGARRCEGNGPAEGAGSKSAVSAQLAQPAAAVCAPVARLGTQQEAGCDPKTPGPVAPCDFRFGSAAAGALIDMASMASSSGVG